MTFAPRSVRPFSSSSRPMSAEGSNTETSFQSRPDNSFKTTADTGRLGTKSAVIPQRDNAWAVVGPIAPTVIPARARASLPCDSNRSKTDSTALALANITHW